jgi:hypothetical protein
MKRDQRFSRSLQSAVLASGTLVGFLGTAITAVAQDLGDLQTPKSPLVLKAQGSFFVGGEKVKQTHVEPGSFGPPGHICINQMYVRYMVPQGGDGNIPSRHELWPAHAESDAQGIVGSGHPVEGREGP